MKLLIDAVVKLARDNYDLHYGWQVIVECMTRSEIEAELALWDISSVKDAIVHFTNYANLHNDQYKDACAEIW